MRRILRLALSTIVLLFACSTSPHGPGTEGLSQWSVVPAIFEEDRVFLQFQTTRSTFFFFSDSGGGTVPFTYRDVLERGGLSFQEVGTPDDRKEGFLGFAEVPGLGRARVFDEKLSKDSELSFIRNFVKDGFVGATYFGRDTWQWDYRRKTFKKARVFIPLEGRGVIPVSFKNEKGERTTNQPLIQIEVDGEVLSVLFDTGATTWYSEEAQKIAGVGEYSASSFIREKVYKRWKSRHPEWKVIKRGERFIGGQDLIRVPEVTIAGVKVGPVWFSIRPDAIYDNYGPKYLGGLCDGAIGGNAFKYMRITADYGEKRFKFETSE